MAETIGTAYIQVEPEAKGIQSKIEEAISGGSQGFGNALTGALGSAAKIAGAAIAGATTAMGAFGAVSVKTGAAFDSSMSQVAATMGVTVDEIGQLRDFAQEMGSTTAFSATEAADALNYMALAGYDAETSMNMLPNVLNLAAAGSIDLARASDMVTDAQTALGLDLEQTTQMVDQMAKTSSISNTSVEQLGDAFLKIGANARDLSGGTVELSQVLGVLADNGIKGSEAGTHLRNIMLSMNPTTDAAAKAWEELGVQAYDAEGNLRYLPTIFRELGTAMSDMTDQEKKKTLSAMFNKTDLASIEALLGTTTERYSELGRAIRTAGVDVGRFKESFKDLGGNYEQIEAAVNALGEANLTDELPRYLELCNGDAEKLAQAMYEDSDATISYDDIVNALGGDLDLLQQAFDDAGGAAQAMAETQLDNLQGDITLFKSALEGVQIAVSDQLTPSLREFVQFGSEGLSKLTEAFNEGGLSGAMEAFGSILSDGLNMIIEKLPDFVDAGMKLLGALGQGILDNLPVIIDAAGQILVQLLEGIMQALPELVDAAIQIVGQLVIFLGEHLPELIPAAIDMVLGIVDALIDNIDLLVDAAIALTIGLAEGLINALPRLLEKAPVIVEKLVEAIIRNVPKLIVAAGEIIGTLLKGIIQNLPKMLEAGMKIISEIRTGMARLLVKIREAGKEAIEKVKEGIKSLDPVQWGKDMIDSFVKGIKEKIANVKQAASDIAQSIKNILGFSEPEEGPLSNFHTFAPDMMDLFAKGIEENANVVRSALYDATADVMAMDYNVEAVQRVQADTNGVSQDYGIISRIEALLMQYLPNLNQNIYLDTGALVGATAGAYDASIGIINARGKNR